MTDWSELPLDLLYGTPVVVTLLGLLIGSFLNVVIHRLPIMLQRAWQLECRSETSVDEDTAEEACPETFNLLWPGSHCPVCDRPIRPLENLPVLSYVILKGRCAGCGRGISWRYPTVELLTALISLLVYLRLGWSLETLAALILSYSLIALAFIDLEHHLLPDAITLPLLWLGLLFSLFPVFADSHASIIGAAAGYLSLWLVYQVFRLLTGKEGMGFGDFKLLALLGAWLGWELLPQIVLLSSLAGTTVGVGLILLKRHERGTPIPFGPFLALAGWLTLMMGDLLQTVTGGGWSTGLVF